MKITEKPGMVQAGSGDLFVNINKIFRIKVKSPQIIRPKGIH